MVLGAHMCDTAKFFGKKKQVKVAKIGQKWPRIRDFGLLKKIMSLVFSGICVK